MSESCSFPLESVRVHACLSTHIAIVNFKKINKRKGSREEGKGMVSTSKMQNTLHSVPKALVRLRLT